MRMSNLTGRKVGFLFLNGNGTTFDGMLRNLMESIHADSMDFECIYFFLFKMIVVIFFIIVTMSLFDYVKNSDYYSKILRTKPQE